MWLTAYGPERHRPKSLRSDDSRVKSTQELLIGWGRRALAMKDPPPIIAGEESARVNDCRGLEGAVASG